MALTQAEQQELEALELEALEKEKALAEGASEELPEGMLEKTKAIGKKGLGFGLRVLNYPVGIVSAGLGTVGSLGKQITGPVQQELRKGNLKSAWEELGKNVVTEQEAKNALNPMNIFSPETVPQPPTFNEYLARMGVPEGGHLSDVVPMAEPGTPYLPEEGGFFDVTPRGVGAGLTTAYLDPITGLVKGALPKINPLKKSAEKIGETTYKSAFKVPDALAKEQGARSLSSFFTTERPLMTPKKMAVEGQKLTRQGINDMRSVIKEATEKYHPQVRTESVIAPALSKAEEIANYELTASKGQALWDKVANISNRGETLPLDKVYDLSKTAGKNAKWAGQASKLPEAEVQQQLRKGAEEAVVDTLAANDPALLNKYMSAKQAVQTGIVTEPHLKKEIGKAIRKNSMTEVKGALAGQALKTADKPEGWFPLLGMYTAKAWNTPLGRTATGNVITKTGELLPMDALLSQYANQRYNQSPWAGVPQGDKNGR